jgi:hypothetical protein
MRCAPKATLVLAVAKVPDPLLHLTLQACEVVQDNTSLKNTKAYMDRKSNEKKKAAFLGFRWSCIPVDMWCTSRVKVSYLLF